MTEIVIEHEGKPTHVVVPFERWQTVQAVLEDFEAAVDAAMAKQILDDPDTEWVPGEVVSRILDGDNPIRAWREHLALTQAELGERAGLPQPTIARLEGGSRKGTVEQMSALAHAFGIRLDTLLAIAGGRPSEAGT